MFVVAGVSGHTGAVVANTLLAQHQPVRVIVRDAAKGAAWQAKGAEVAVADLTDASALTKALKGAQSVYLLIPPNFGATDYAANAKKHIDAAVAALTANSVPHAVLLSSIGAQHTSGTGPIVQVHLAEQAFAGLKTHVTLLRPGYFMENLLGSLAPMKSDGVLPTFFNPETTFNLVATADIGAEAAHLLRLGINAPRLVELGTPGSLKEVAAAFGTALSRTIKLAPVPAEAHVATFKSFGMPELWAKGYTEMNRAMDAGLIQPEGTVTRGLTSLAHFAKQAVSAKAPAGH